MRNRFIPGVIISMLLLTLAACVYDTTFSYLVINKSSAPIKISFEGKDEDEVESHQTVIPPNSEQIIFIEKDLVQYDRFDSTMYIFTYFDVVKNDTVPSVSDFKMRDKWMYVVTNSNYKSFAAKYTAEITDADF